MTRGEDPAERLAALRAAAFNTARLPAAAVPCDLSTDLLAPPVEDPEDDPMGALDRAIRAVLGGAAWIPAPLGRGAEAIVAATLARPGARVLASEVYVTGEWALRRCGARLDDLSLGTFHVDPGDGPREAPSPGEAAAALGAGVDAIWIATPRSRLGPRGGAVIPLAGLRALAAARDAHAPDAPIVVDASRLGEWAARSGAPVAAAVRELVGLADLAVLSGRKDAGGARLGVVVVGGGGRVSAADLEVASDMLLGTCPHDPVAITALARGLGRLPLDAGARWRALRGLARDLAAAGVPLVGVGGGAVFLDAAALLPALPAGALAAPTLLALLYRAAGVRGLGTPVTDDGPAIVRLSPRGPAQARWLAAEVPALARALAGWRHGLRAGSAPAPAPFLEPLVADDPGAWEAAPLRPLAPATGGPAALGTAAGEGLAAAVRARLGVDARWSVFPSRRPLSRLLEAWLRLAPAAVIDAGGERRAAASVAFWRARTAAPAEPSPVLGDLSLRSWDDPTASSAALARDLGPAQRWRPGALAGAALGWSDDLGSGRGGVVVVRGDHPLAAALTTATLFTAGPPDVGDLDDGALRALVAALA